MAFSTNMIWEIRSQGTANAGGGFLSGASGTDRSQQNAVHSARTDIVIDGSDATKITSAADPFASDDVGNVVNIVSGTGFTVQRLEILSVASNIATCDKSAGTLGSTGGTGDLGGSISTMTDAFFESWAAGNVAYIKQDGTHTTSSSISVAKDGTALSPMLLQGYKTTRGDAVGNEANRPTISLGVNLFTFDNFWRIQDLILTGTASVIIDMDDSGIYSGCKVTNTSATVARSAAALALRSVASECEFISDKGWGLKTLNRTGTIIDCNFHDCDPGGTSYGGLSMGNSSDNRYVGNCTFRACANGLTMGSSEKNILEHLTFNNCNEGLNMSTPSSTKIAYCIFDSCVTGMSRSASITTNNPDVLLNLNFSNNTADKTNIGTVINETSLDPQFVDAANGDLETGSNMEFTFAYPGGTTSTTIKLGAVQNAGGGGMLVHPGTAGGIHG